MQETTAQQYFMGGGEMGERTRRHPWEQTPLGPVASWPGSLRSAVATMLECKLPMYLAWGPEFVQLYNDAYRPILGDKHPAALGASTPRTWSEIWPTIGPMWQQVLGGEAIGFDDFKLTIDRFGYPEDCYFNFSYSPLRDDAGHACGVLVTFAETTRRVVSERRLRFLDDLTQATRALTDPEEAMRVTAAMLGGHLEVNRCAYAHVLENEDTFDLVGDYNDGVSSIVGQYRFSDFGATALRAMRENRPYVVDDVETDPQTAGMDLAAYRTTQIRSVICVPLHKQGRFVAAMAVHQNQPRHWFPDDVELVQTVLDRCFDTLERMRSETAQREEARLLEILNRTGASLASELDLQALLQQVTDAATELTGARFGAFFYNGLDSNGEAYLLYTLAGAPRAAFENFGHPRPTPLFGPTFRGDSPIRLDDVLADARYGQWGPHHGMPKGHLPVRSYLAVPVTGRTGEVIGGLFFGHPEPGVFTARSEQLAVGIAGQAAIAIDNARLYARAQQSAEERKALLESERAARLEAEQASTVKDEFLATLSHELRTPLSAIQGWVHILRRKLSAQQSDLLRGVEVIDRSTRVQLQLIDDLLDMSRIRAGKMSLDRQPVAPVAFVQAAVDMVRPAAESAGVGVITELEAVGAVLGDAGRLQQVIWNLLANAVKFTPRGGEVRVVLRERAGAAEIGVSDTGCGIRPDNLSRIFERFRQADSSITRKHGGLGLGLSIVSHLVEAHGGRVTAESAGEGRGATFTVSLPLLETEQPDATVRRPASIGREPESPDLREVKVLVVDDEPHSRELLERLLTECGAEVRSACDASAALATLQSYKPHVLISDIGMPEIDGYELLRRVRGLPQPALQGVPAIALTAFARAEDHARSMRSGFDAHLTKPMNPAQVLSVVASLARLDNSEARLSIE
ncbi:MAG TPA: GAF domain-containing protein [Solimonas sp.]|nr:GAF domain-containing protein [Solimonas sp.]